MWQERNDILVKEFSFADFKSALAFVNQIGELAEAANHHPDVNLSWGRVTVSLTTHDEGGVTEKDRQLAHAIDEAVGLKEV
ncbi:MAG TPA: 4a-hydroxytetrahydrobiopterin dehydratase [Candidatus Saccharimonadales bacterium]|nr:4a-hydroxytetrahydrobiopterin dehydratase [Candidatus Saccharimonadales bacterium]